MQQALATVPGMLGGSLQIRRLTSSTAAQGSRTYAVAVAFSGLIQGRTFDHEMDQTGMLGYARHDTAELSVDGSILVNPGDLIIDTDGTTQWAIITQLTSGSGTKTYRLGQDSSPLGSPDRSGGVLWYGQRIDQPK